MRLHMCLFAAKIGQKVCSNRFGAEFGSVQHNMACRPSRLGSSSANLSLTRHIPVQVHAQLIWAWLGLAQSALDLAVQ